MKATFIFFLLIFSYSDDDCEVNYGKKYETTFSRTSESSCYIILNSIFLNCNSETSGGAISIKNKDSYSVLNDCSFIRCQSKAQAACIYFSGVSIEASRCCCLNCTARYNSMFLSSEIKSFSKGGTVIDMLTVSHSTSQVNAFSCKNRNAYVTNVNLTKSNSMASILAVELTEVEEAEIAFFTFFDNSGDAQNNAIMQFVNEFEDGKECVHHGNFIKNTCLKGGYIFNMVAETDISNCIFQDNARAILTAIRYYVTFDSCVFDGAEARTEFLTAKNCQFLTQTSTFQFTMMECNDSAIELALESGNNVRFVHLPPVGIALIVAGIVTLLAVISLVIFFARKRKNDDEVDADDKVDQNKKENVLSTIPLIQ